ncbi:MAG TPA: amidohydrolase family protein [Chitinophagaceae bacterium]|jgi:cytosine/adenosine deaminase-related metal-dependent hydrolase|nr:amidohydrolase family protein [Chitinophagaceae bacterium]
MILYNCTIPGWPGRQHVRCNRGIIQAITDNRDVFGTVDDADRYECNGAKLLPGFINSHDHLDFNLFPALSTRGYNNYSEWGPDIQAVYANEINAVKQVPLPLRIKWGLYKNLLNGFTTVVNHGEKLKIEDDLINVFQNCYSLHSLAFEKKWKWKLNNPFRSNQPVVIHAGEGTDEIAENEITRLTKANYFDKKIIAVHGVAMKQSQASSFAGLVWCPSSNFFLLGQTTNVDELNGYTQIVFGTDSTLTSSWNCWEHFRCALQTKMVCEKELLAMLSQTPALLWDLAQLGEVREGAIADLLLLPQGDTIFCNDPSDILAVIKQGEFRVADSDLFPKETLPLSFQSSSTQVVFGDARKSVYGDLANLVSEIKKYYPQYENRFCSI